MRHNPGGVFGGIGWRGAPSQPPPYERYATPKPSKRHNTHAPGNTCWCGYAENRKRLVMSAALWCDAGDHAFSSNDEYRHRFSETKMEKDPEYGGQREVTTTVDVCGPCWSNNNPFQKDREKTTLPANERNSFVDGAQDESYLRGYRDGVVKGETIA